MTAEVAILNSSGIAIAADSAVTIGRGTKIYNSALKVFMLSKTAPVGIMVYGNAGLLQVPWETIIKVYRSELKAKSFPRLEDYASDFLTFLPRQARFFPRKSQDRWTHGNITGYFAAVRDDFMKTVGQRLKEDGHITEETSRELFSASVEQHHLALSKLPYLDNMSRRWEMGFKRRINGILDGLIKEVFQDTPIARRDRAKLADIAAFVHARNIISSDHAGVVICGFGDEDIFPSIVTHLIDGVYEDRLKVSKSLDKCFRIKDGSECSIIPFAQDDMVASFMEGMNPTVQRFTHGYLHQLVARLPELLPDAALVGTDKDRHAVREKLREDVNKLLTDFFLHLDVHKREEHVDPILSMVRVLPKDELAAMAESLVNLTAFKRRMTDELETVGGPIDVAVISKGDGFVWVKRKHYFPPALNQHFFANYFRGVEDGSQ